MINSLLEKQNVRSPCRKAFNLSPGAEASCWYLETNNFNLVSIIIPHDPTKWQTLHIVQIAVHGRQQNCYPFSRIDWIREKYLR